jgi:23S rRNA (cytosine1962-C5)-methyltransferase
MAAALRVILKRGRSKPFWVGHPWVFSGAIHKIEGTIGEMGGPCLIEDERGNILGAGWYNPHATISVRILEHRRSTDLPFEPRPLLNVVEERLACAIGKRKALRIASDETTAYRLVNAEGDAITGMIVDRLGDVLVLQSGSRAMYEVRSEVAELLCGLLNPKAVVHLVSHTASRLEAIPAEVEVLKGEVSGPTEFCELGIRYRVDILASQKTGFYADQRENRRQFGEICAGETMLDLFSYHGAFGLHAARAGALSVTSVDSSAKVCDNANVNIKLNGFPSPHEVVCSDSMNFLKEARSQGTKWSRIVCDPPKFAQGRARLDDALKKYARLNTLAMETLTEDGLMLTCSCSQHVSTDAFLRMLTDAGHRVRKAVHVHQVWGQGLDHPYVAVAPEGRYLKAALISLSSA